MAAQAVELQFRSDVGPTEPESTFFLDDVRHRVPFRESVTVAYEDCAAVRSFSSWPGKKNYAGSYWASTGQRHIGFESLYERTALMTLDRDPQIVGLSSQPMWIHWPRGAAVKNHAPDYFARHINGDGEVIDVRPLSHLDADTRKVFDATRELCFDAGFGYRVISELRRELDQNLKFLSRYRSPAWEPSTEQRNVLARVDGPLSVRALGRILSADDNVAGGLGCVYWLIWNSGVHADLDRPLTLDTRVSVPTRAERM